MIGESMEDDTLSYESDILRELDELKEKLKHAVPVQLLQEMVNEWEENVNRFGDSTMRGEDCTADVEALISLYR